MTSTSPWDGVLKQRPSGQSSTSRTNGVPTPQLWTKAAHSVSAGKDSESQEASLEPAIELIVLWLPVPACVLAGDLYSVNLPATGTGPTARAARISRQHGSPNGHVTILHTSIPQERSIPRPVVEDLFLPDCGES